MYLQVFPFNPGGALWFTKHNSDTQMMGLRMVMRPVYFINLCKYNRNILHI